MSSDESDDLAPPLLIRVVRTSYPHIWSDDSVTCSSDEEAGIKNQKNKSGGYTSRGRLKQASRNVNKVSVSTSSAVTDNSFEPNKTLDAARDAALGEKPSEKFCSPAVVKSVCMEGDDILQMKSTSTLPTIRQCDQSSIEESANGGRYPEESSPTSNDESSRRLMPKCLRSRNHHAVGTDQKSIEVEADEPAAENTSTSTSSNVVRDGTSNLIDNSDFRNCTTRHFSNEKSRKRANSNAIVKMSHSRNKKVEVSDTTHKSPDKKLILSPRSARLARACFGEKPKRTKFSRIIFSSDEDCDVTNPDKVAQSPSTDLPACDQTMCSPKVDLDVSGTTISTTFASKSQKSCPKASPGSSCSIGMLFLDENPSTVRPPPKKKSPLKQAVRSPAKVELLADDGLWSNRR